MFVDRVMIEVAAGRGGNGCVSFRRERYVPRGGPDGGDGGDGGSVLIRVEAGVDNLSALAHRKTWKAARGGHGEGSHCHGRSAGDVVLKVPPGTVVLDPAENLVLRDLTQPGDQIIAARGGKGGKGNAHFRSATNRVPRECTAGGEGQQRRLILELKSIADVGLIGKPNAGKSTLLSRLTRARPAIGDYPFTTKHPNLGQVQIDFEQSFILADIPGLIEGAHSGAGLGAEFLRHVERAGILVHLIEPAPQDGSEPQANYEVLRQELKQHRVGLELRAEIVAVTKGELPGAEEVRQKLEQSLGRDVLLISAVTGQGLNRLVRTAADALARHKAAEAATAGRA